jgi:hypothetical protein
MTPHRSSVLARALLPLIHSFTIFLLTTSVAVTNRNGEDVALLRFLPAIDEAEPFFLQVRGAHSIFDCCFGVEADV